MTTSGFAYPGTELEALEEARNYYDWILSKFAPYLGSRVIELGAGTGTFSEVLLSHPAVRELVAVEPAENLFPRLANRLAGDRRVTLVRGAFGEAVTAACRADSVVMVNVLEHVAADEALLRELYAALVPGGTLLLFVPALPWLYGTLDEAVGHVRRYTKASLAGRLRRAGFRPLRLFYFNAPGVATWFVAGRLLRRRTLRPRDVRLYDRWVVPWVSWLERRLAPPMGQSLVAIAAKAERDSA